MNGLEVVANILLLGIRGKLPCAALSIIYLFTHHFPLVHALWDKFPGEMCTFITFDKC